MKRSALAPALAALCCAPLGAALRSYFGMLKLDKAGNNAARFDYAALQAPFRAAYAELAGGPYKDCTLDLNVAAAAAAGGRRRAAAASSPAATGRKRGAAAAAAETPAPAAALQFESSKRQRGAAPTRKSPRRP